MKRLNCALTAVCLFSIIPAGVRADIQLPERKAGLWEISVSTDTMGSKRYEMKQCIDATTDAKLLQSGTDMGAQMRSQCSKNAMRKESDGKYSGESECTFNGVKAKSKTNFSGDFSKAYSGEISTTYTPPMQGITANTTKLNAKWAGACAPGQKPGDMVLPGGITMNVNDVDMRPAARR